MNADQVLTLLYIAALAGAILVLTGIVRIISWFDRRRQVKAMHQTRKVGKYQRYVGIMDSKPDDY